MKKFKTIRKLQGLLWTLLWILVLSQSALAQVSKVSGTITAQKTGAAMAGVTVTVKGTSRTVTTNEAGQFTIDAAPGDVLVVSSVGYVSQEMKVSGTSGLSARLEEDYQRLEDVVVIGYGTQKKKLTTGANLQVRGENIQKQSTTSALQALQGQRRGCRSLPHQVSQVRE
jgi:outer membrane receptor protein involved in Fe transport